MQRHDATDLHWIQTQPLCQKNLVNRFTACTLRKLKIYHPFNVPVGSIWARSKILNCITLLSSIPYTIFSLQFAASWMWFENRKLPRFANGKKKYRRYFKIVLSRDESECEGQYRLSDKVSHRLKFYLLSHPMTKVIIDFWLQLAKHNLHLYRKTLSLCFNLH